MASEVTLSAEPRSEKGKGAVGRLRRTGRTPAIVYGREVEPFAVSVDALELYHALRTEAGLNVLLNLEVDGDAHLAVPREIQRHPVRGDVMHVDFLAVSRDQAIGVEIPVHLLDEESARESGGVVNLVLGNVPIMVRPTDVPSHFELSVEGMEIGDVKRVEDLTEQLPEGAEFDIDVERTIVTINPPDILEEPEPEEVEEALEEGELPPAESVAGEAPEDASEVPAEGAGPTTE